MSQCPLVGKTAAAHPSIRPVSLQRSKHGDCIDVTYVGQAGRQWEVLAVLLGNALGDLRVGFCEHQRLVCRVKRETERSDWVLYDIRPCRTQEHTCVRLHAHDVVHEAPRSHRPCSMPNECVAGKWSTITLENPQRASNIDLRGVLFLEGKHSCRPIVWPTCESGACRTSSR